MDFNNQKSNTAINLSVLFIAVIAATIVGVVYLPSLVQDYFSSQAIVLYESQPLQLPQMTAGDTITSSQKFQNLQIPEGIPLTIPTGLVGKSNPFAPL